MKILKGSFVFAVSFIAVYCVPMLVNASDTLIHIAKGTEIQPVTEVVNDDTTTLIIAVVVAVVNLIVHIFGSKKKK